ncbi:hypothetical protein A1O1_07862 [Capronia coronata CBS 617.96]|uniref:AGC-kinase C-terminal domain-containing protein n=1 Tax=Capronia coronata CBS 617.96 TaxID=1182541 RepID=W9XMN1_9EURO|nr:uncharacterized protein A1O1_07862 [Capronia coronata CBS 617.96]EXJ81797.1 hypothetical protein A1O1_07862 [Capronia coronata CBS 617.96]
MSNTKIHYQPLQRHRRRSDHVSPTSPSFSRRIGDRPNRLSDAISPVEATSGTDDSDSPSRNLALSSPSCDRYTALPSAPPLTQGFINDQTAFQRSSDETGRPRYRTSNEAARPATSDAIDPHHITPHTRPSPNAQGFYHSKPSPVSYVSSPPEPRGRISSETPIKSSDYGSSPSLRTYSFDRAMHDDSGSAKGHAGKKSRLNLLNPMSLLARRRASQNQKLEDVSLSIKTLSVPALPDNFDPSIRGKVVHDFSAPRARRIYSHNDITTLESPVLRSGYGPDPSRTSESPNPRVGSGGTPPVPHSPMFKEHFQDDRPSLQPERTGYLHNISAFGTAKVSEEPERVPAFAKRLPPTVPQPGAQTDSRQGGKENLPSPAPKESSPSPAPSPPTPPPKSTPSPRFDAPPPAVLPKHMTSTSSRFSFQIGESGSSAQEKLLEEKHKEHEATKKSTCPDAGEDEDDYDNYDFDADDGLEEKIPGVNADFDEDEVIDPTEGNALEARYAAPHVDEELCTEANETGTQRRSLQGFHFTPQSMTFSPTSTNHGSQPTPRDHDGFAIGIADSIESSQEEPAGIESKDGIVEGDMVSMFDGLGIRTTGVHARRSQQFSRPQGQVFNDDDLYFDDGEFGDVALDMSGTTFDEQMFDDDAGQIRDIPAENARRFEEARQLAGIDGEVKAVVPGDDQADVTAWSKPEKSQQGSQHSAGHEPVSPESPSPGGHVAGLTETNLAAYHDALAFAANQAAASGKFDRKVSFGQTSDDSSLSRLEDSQQGVISDDSRFSNHLSSAIAEDDGFPFDDDLADDPMIAEANAEALANDDDGFYGQEFGFYARSHGKGSSEPVNGGYFAERGSNGIKRSHSGKATFQEPSLTPITERSEWSTRNSVVSLQLPGGVPASAQSMPSPGIAQLLELDSPGYDEDMSFSSLMKLRGRTFGGSSSSVNSLGSGYAPSSPLAHVSSHPFAQSDIGLGRMSSSMQRQSSSAGIPESEEENDEDGDRPTLTQNTPRKHSGEVVALKSQEDLVLTPASFEGERRKGHHSRTSSGADSVSYARDTDGRWVLERRRTDEDSGTEFVDREYIAGARI